MPNSPNAAAPGPLVGGPLGGPLGPEPRASAGLLLQSPLLLERGFLHGFSTRAVDIRPGRPEHEAELARFCAAAGLPSGRVHQAKQVHGTHVARGDLEAMGPWESTLEADAWAAPIREGSIDVIGVRVADCLPILVGAREGRSGAVAAIHAGWRGLVRGVIQAALAEVDALAPGARRTAATGPCIGPCCFEVGADVADEITRAAGDTSVVARRTEQGKAFVDLKRAARLVLLRAGFGETDIDDVPGCTRCDAARFFSYRREADQSGRHLAAIFAGANDGAPP